MKYLFLSAAIVYVYGIFTAAEATDKQCTIRILTTNSYERALKEVKTHLPESLASQITIFSFQQRYYIPTLGPASNCAELQEKLSQIKSYGYKNAYFVDYDPKHTSLVKISSSKQHNAPLADSSKSENTAEPEVPLSTKQVSESSQPIAAQEPQQEPKTSPFTEVEVRGTIGATFNTYSSAKTADTLAIEGNAELTKEYGWGKTVANLILLADGSDSRRRYLIPNELYAKYNLDAGYLQAGRNVRTWGALEGYSATDVFNTKNYLSDAMDANSKYGAFNAEYTYQPDIASFSVIAKLEEAKQPYPAEDNVYNFYHYDSKLTTEKSKYRPTLYLKYSNSAEVEGYQSDYSFILQNGYDNKRDIVENGGNVSQNAYLVNKALAYAVVGKDSLIYKGEVAYTDVDSYSPISDYLQAGFGVEYLPNFSLSGAEVRFIGECYFYHYFDDTKDKYNDFSEMFDHDIFIGAQSSFGDSGSSEIKGGILKDIQNDEQVYTLHFSTRMKQNYRMSMEWRVFVPGTSKETAIGQMGQFNQAIFKTNYFF